MIENFKDLNLRTTQDTCRISVFKFKVIFNEDKKYLTEECLTLIICKRQ